MAVPDLKPDPPRTTPVYEKALHREGAKTLDELFKAELADAKAHGKQVIVLFGADWCSPCQSIKELFESSEALAAQVTGGRFLHIDVDEWRGPAHRLIEGVVPSKLPTIVRVDHNGAMVQTAMGSSLGLLDGETTGRNLKRLIDGKPTEEPQYLADPERKRQLLVADSRRKQAAVAGVEPVAVKVLGKSSDAAGNTTWTIALDIRNLGQRRRWYVMPTALPKPVGKPFEVEAKQFMRFAEHGRAGMHRFHLKGAGTHLDLLAVSNYGSAHFGKWTVTTKPDERLAIWEVDRVRVDDTALQFDKKVPYALKIEDGTKAASRTRTELETPAKLSIIVQQVLPLPLPGT